MPILGGNKERRSEKFSELKDYSKNNDIASQLKDEPALGSKGVFRRQFESEYKGGKSKIYKK